MTTDTPRRTTGLSLRARALKALAGREHSRDGLRRKLLAHADEAAGGAEAVERLLDEFETRGLLSNRRFAESVVHRRAEGYGARRVKDELQRQGVEAALVAETVGRLQDSEWTRAHALWQHRYGEVAADERERARQARFLLSRGFSPEVVQKLVRGRWEAT